MIGLCYDAFILSYGILYYNYIIKLVNYFIDLVKLLYSGRYIHHASGHLFVDIRLQRKWDLRCKLLIGLTINYYFFDYRERLSIVCRWRGPKMLPKFWAIKCLKHSLFGWDTTSRLKFLFQKLQWEMVYALLQRGSKRLQFCKIRNRVHAEHYTSFYIKRWLNVPLQISWMTLAR